MMFFKDRWWTLVHSRVVFYHAFPRERHLFYDVFPWLLWQVFYDVFQRPMMDPCPFKSGFLSCFSKRKAPLLWCFSMTFMTGLLWCFSKTDMDPCPFKCLGPCVCGGGKSGIFKLLYDVFPWLLWPLSGLLWCFSKTDMDPCPFSRDYHRNFRYHLECHIVAAGGVFACDGVAAGGGPGWGPEARHPNAYIVAHHTRPWLF